MHKQEFITHIANQHKVTKIEAGNALNMVTDSIIDALSKGEEINLVGFGNFTVSDVAARTGRNPQTGKEIQISARKQPKFKVGKVMKDACNK